MPIEFGGIVGGNMEVAEVGYYSGMSYEVRFGNAIIMQGRLYFNMPRHNNPSAGPYTCVDLATGKILWQKEGISPSFGELYDYESPNQHGVIPSGALYQTSGSTWIAYDPFTGEWIYNFTNVPSGTQVLQNDGTIARYQLNYNTTTKSGWLAKWTTAALPLISPRVLNNGTTTDAYQYRSYGKVMNMRNNYEWNVTINYDITGSSSPSIVTVLPGDIILGRSSNIAVTSTWRGTDDPWTMWAVSDKQNTRGQLIWKQSHAAPPGNITQMLGYQPVDEVNRVFTMTYFETGERLGYDLDTGDYMWGPVGTPYQEDHAFQYFSSRAGQHAYGKLIVSGYGGEVFAYDTTNGNKIWNFNDTSHGIESNWGMVPTFVSMMADGKVFAIGGEHSPNVPLYKDEHLYAIDATTGREIWNLTAWSATGLGEAAANMYIADGKLLFHNLYDGQIYCIGKGPSETTVSAPQLAATVGSSVMITGSVTDQSPGAMGKAAVSDAWMTPWMEYLYMQQPLPTSAVGVTVKLKAYDSSGTEIDIGETTTDLKGNFAKAWQPTAAGQYTIVATFDGSDSYWQSYDTAYLVVDAAPSASPIVTPTPPPTSPTPTPTPTTPAPTVVPTPPGAPVPAEVYVAIAAVVIIVAIAAAAVYLRRRK
jgi:outer membrane protein assembly factor BamB